MNDLIQIKVKSHSGYKSNEYPKYFYWEGIRFNILEILDRWYQGDLDPEFTPAYYFKVKTEDEKIYILKYAEQIDKWFLLIHGESMNL